MDYDFTHEEWVDESGQSLPHSDHSRINDLPLLSKKKAKELEDNLLSSKPAHIKWVGEDKIAVVRHKDWKSMARGNNWPWDRDQIDYDPYQDESWGKWGAEDEH